MLKANAIDHLNLTVNNLEESVMFYKKLFGLEEKERGKGMSGTDFVIVGKPGSLYLCLYQSETGEIDKGNFFGHIGVHVENFDEALLKLKELGIKPNSEFDYENSQSIYIDDPSGIEIEITSNFGGGLN